MTEDESIIELFFQRSEQAIRKLDLSYGKVCHKTAYNILHSMQDAEECVNDAYLVMWNAIPPKRPNPLLTYLCKIVRNLSITRFHANTAKKRNSAYDVVLEELDDCLASIATVETEMETKELTGMIEGFLETLTQENRVIFMRRYWFCDTYVEIAKRVGLTKKNVSVRLTRMRKQLKEYLEEREVWV